jgi:putative ABC transport system permease protein
MMSDVMERSLMLGGDGGIMPVGMEMSQMQGGDAGSMPDGMDMSQMQGGDAGSMPDGMDMSQMQGGDAGSMPDGADMGQMQGGDAGSMPDGTDASQIQSEEAVDGETEADTDAAAAEVQDAEEEAVDEEAADEDTDDEEDSIIADRLNQEQITLTEDDVDDLETFIPGISEATISYTTRSSIEGGNLTDAQTYTVAGVTENFASLSRLDMAEGEFITASDNENKSRICVLGASAAKELFGSAMEAYDSTIYIDDRAYVVNGVLSSTGMVSAGISPDDAIFVPYNTGLKYITGTSVSPTITVISEDVDAIDTIIDQVSQVLAQNYSNAEFTYSDAGSKMEAAESSNQILTMLLSAMAVIVFLVGGIGIMNVLFVSVKERTNEIGILKALGASRATILSEFLMESAAISLMGGVLGVGLSTAITPIVEYYGVRVEANISAWMAALGFALLTGTIFGFYPAWKASRLVPVDALQAE